MSGPGIGVVVDLEYVNRRVEEIRLVASDDERAHGMKDALRGDVLEAIANGAPNAADLAAAVLATSDIDFARWCA